MAVRMLVPWLGYKPGDTVDMGAAVDEKLILSGKAEPAAAQFHDVKKAAKGQREKR